MYARAFENPLIISRRVKIESVVSANNRGLDKKMERPFSALASTAWFCISVVLLPKIIVGQQTCGGTIELDSSREFFVLNSPNYFSQPSVYTDCYWYVTGPAGKQVQLVWLDIETSNEYLKVYDHPSSTSYQVSEFLGNVDADLSPFVSTRGGITIYLEDASSGSGGKGFLANVSLSDGSSVVGPRSCGGTVTLSDSMPNFILNSPYYYQPSSQAYVGCFWHVHGSSGQEVELTWSDIDTPNDYVYLYDDPYSASRTVSSIRGDIDVDVSPVISSNGGWTVQHVDQYSGNSGRGFLAEFRLRDTPYYASPASCGGSIQLTQSSPSVTFSTPHYYQPSTTDVNMNCFWYITSPSGKQVQLTVLDLQSPEEFFYIYDHPTSTSYLVSSLNGLLESPATVLSSRGGVTVHYFDYFSTYNGPGLLFEARILDSKPDHQTGFCGGTVALTDSSPDFTFTTPLYNNPSTLDVYKQCWMYITGPAGKQVQMTIRDFNTTVDEEIDVYDHPSSPSSSDRVSLLSGLSASQVVVISSRGGLTLFYDDNNRGYNGPGAFIKAHIIDAVPSSISGSCGGVIPLSTSTPSVTTTTPLFYQPSSSDVYIDCWWYITSPPGKQVEMSIHDLQTKYEQVYVMDHPSSSNQYHLSDLQGDVRDSTVVSTRGGFSVIFHDTLSSGNGPGFAMDVTLTDEFTWDDDGIDSCGQTIYLDTSSPSIVFSTPTYPMEVLHDRYYCFWYLTCPEGYRISLLFLDFNTSSYSSIRVFDYSPDSWTYQLAYISAISVPGTAAIQSSSNRLTVYYADTNPIDVTKQRGVLAKAAIVPEGEPIWDKVEPMSSCGSDITLTEEENRIELTTPDYPHVSGDYYECKWFVQCPIQAVVRIDFDDFWIDSSGMSGYLRVDDPTASIPNILHATGSSLPESVVSSSNVMTTYYYNNRGTSGKGASFAMSCVFEDGSPVGLESGL